MICLQLIDYCGSEAIKMWKIKDISTFSVVIGLFRQNYYRPAEEIWLLKWTQIDEHNTQLTLRNYILAT